MTTNNQRAESLKACPGDAPGLVHHVTLSVETEDRITHDAEQFYANCSCGFRGPYRDTSDEAITAWNSRSPVGVMGVEGETPEVEAALAHADMVESYCKEVEGGPGVADASCIALAGAYRRLRSLSERTPEAPEERAICRHRNFEDVCDHCIRAKEYPATPPEAEHMVGLESLKRYTPTPLHHITGEPYEAAEMTEHFAGEFVKFSDVASLMPVEAKEWTAETIKDAPDAGIYFVKSRTHWNKHWYSKKEAIEWLGDGANKMRRAFGPVPQPSTKEQQA